MKKQLTTVLLAACAAAALIPGSAAHATESESGTKRCGKGQQVIISSFAGGHVIHKFKTPGKGHHVYTHDFGGTQGWLFTVRYTPTGKRAITYKIIAKDTKKVKNAFVQKKHLLCKKF
ncbi:hypothetical protein [Streptomyces sp. NPDC059009]|uniref:hypothetical protein n=1 Tax=Streptomyces sp. NPDC059009 TaxID=3346694 RepID=UPI0036C31468